MNGRESNELIVLFEEILKKKFKGFLIKISLKQYYDSIGNYCSIIASSRVLVAVI